ncbi:phage tail protein, partial [Oceanicella sp. SM1341]|uniref:phage tail protein n=1 Tax=Oceanicella sp. SM1341 TaxID=1548889 RepID=UPI0013004275
GTERRYRVGGVVIFSDAEIEDQVEPLMLAGASGFTRVGGRLGFIPGTYRAPTQELSVLIGDGFEFTRLKTGRELPTQVRATYTSAARGYETAELAPWDIPGAQAEDGGIPAVTDMRFDMVTSPTQAMRLRKIGGWRARRQKALTGVAPPSAFRMVAGATVTVALPAPFTALGGVYEVQGLHPAASLVGDDEGVALRCPVQLLELGPEPYTWDAEAEEEEIVEEAFDATRTGIGLPGPLSATTGP